MIRDPDTGRWWGTAVELSAALTGDDVVTVAMIYNWRRRDGLTTRKDSRSGTVVSPLDEARRIERDKRLSKEETGRGRARRVDVGLVNAA